MQVWWEAGCARTTAVATSGGTQVRNACACTAPWAHAEVCLYGGSMVCNRLMCVCLCVGSRVAKCAGVWATPVLAVCALLASGSWRVEVLVRDGVDDRLQIQMDGFVHAALHPRPPGPDLQARHHLGERPCACFQLAGVALCAQAFATTAARGTAKFARPCCSRARWASTWPWQGPRSSTRARQRCSKLAGACRRLSRSGRWLG